MSDKVVELIKSINEFVSKAEDSDSLYELLAGHPNRGKLIEAIEDYETVIGKLLRNQKKELVEALRLYTEGATSDNPIASAIAQIVLSDIQEGDNFNVEMAQASSSFLLRTVPELTTELMSAIDKDVQFNILSQRTLTWIDEWSNDLGNLMKISTHDKVHKIIRNGIDEGLSIVDIELKLMELPEFDRNRARRTAITEVLTANSVAQQEAYDQSPAVVGKTWLHSGGRFIEPRPTHVALNGTTVNLKDYFNVGGYEGMYPRDVNLPASERVNCHCVLAPAVDEDILGLTQDEKEIIRQQAMRELEGM